MCNPFALIYGKETTMKKSTGMIISLCVLLTATACNADKTEESSSTTSASQTTSATQTEDTSKTEATVQTEQTEDIVPEVVPSETETQILNISRKYVYQYEWIDGNVEPIVICEGSAVILNDEDAERYPELAKALSDSADYQEIYINEEFAGLKDQALASEGTDTLISTMDMQVRRADSSVVSVLYDSYLYNGMNEGSRGFGGAVYDTATGKTLHLPDVVTDIDAFAKTVEDQLFGTVGADMFYRDDIIKEYFEMYGADGTHWTLDYNGITMYFDEGEIADRGFGAMSVTITFAEHPELFNEKYTEVPEAYIVSLPMKSAFYTDLDGNGSCEELTIYDRYDEENVYSATVDICTADDMYTESLWAYGCEPCYVKTADGKHYLYLFTELETQMYLYVYDITNGTVSKAGESNVAPYYNDGISAVPTDPDSMHFDIFGDGAGGGISDISDIFTVGADGMPAQG